MAAAQGTVLMHSDAVHPQRVVRFGAFEVDLHAGELRKRGLKVKLQQQPFQVLGLLLQNPGEVVTREELRKKLWSEETFVDFDHGFNTAINRIRKALGDSAGNPRFVETLPGYGYRFIAPVARDRPLISPSESVERRRKLLVLPLGGTDCSDQDYLVDGLTEEMIAHLGRMHGDALGVIARNTAMCYKNSEKPINQIAAELGVDYVLTGKVGCVGNRLEVTAELIEAADQTYLWVDRYEWDAAEAGGLEREIAARVAASLGVPLGPTGRAAVRRTDPARHS